MNAVKSKSPDSLVQNIMKYFDTKALRHGDPRLHGLPLEPRASKTYETYKSVEGVTVPVQECGLLVSSNNPFLATNTDGIITDSSTYGEGVLEIKCPVSMQDICEPVKTRKQFCLKKDPGGVLCLRKIHPLHSGPV